MYPEWIPRTQSFCLLTQSKPASRHAEKPSLDRSSIEDRILPFFSNSRIANNPKIERQPINPCSLTDDQWEGAGRCLLKPIAWIFFLHAAAGLIDFPLAKFVSAFCGG